jgi:acyl-CoA hydrolase
MENGPACLKIQSLASFLPVGGLTLVQGCSGESLWLARAVRDLGSSAGALRMTGIFVPGLNRVSWLPNTASHLTTFFMTPELRRFGNAVEFLPLCYQDILNYLRRSPPQAALFMVAPPDAEGNCSFGTTVDFLADLWPQIPVRIAQINPAMPRTNGHRGIPFRDLTAYIEEESPLLGMADDGTDDVAEAIGKAISAYVPDAATLQVGLGRIPGATLRALRGHRNLRIHSGLIGDAVLDLAEAGALAEGAAVTAGVAIGSPRLYNAVTDERFSFRPVSYTHDAAILARCLNLVTVNSSLSVDLFGQAYAELTPRGLMSGPGGASDFARGARAGGGLRVIALPATAGDISRIVPPGGGAGPVSLGRMDIDIVVTEHGAADLRDLGHGARAAALINIAAPVQREALAAAWHAYARQF